MTKRSSIVLAVTAAALTLSLVVGNASANRLSTSGSPTYFIWNDESQRLTYEGGGITIECEVTFLGSLARTFSKVRGTTIGNITHAEVDTPGCNGGTWSFPSADLPWDITYSSFAGRLPTITSIEVAFLKYTFLISYELQQCIARSDASDPVIEQLQLSGGTVTALVADPDPVINFDDLTGSILCDLAAGMIFAGAASAENGSGGTIRITLI